MSEVRLQEIESINHAWMDAFEEYVKSGQKQSHQYIFYKGVEARWKAADRDNLAEKLAAIAKLSEGIERILGKSDYVMPVKELNEQIHMLCTTQHPYPLDVADEALKEK